MRSSRRQVSAATASTLGDSRPALDRCSVCASARRQTRDSRDIHHYPWSTAQVSTHRRFRPFGGRRFATYERGSCYARSWAPDTGDLCLLAISVVLGPARPPREASRSVGAPAVSPNTSDTVIRQGSAKLHGPAVSTGRRRAQALDAPGQATAYSRPHHEERAVNGTSTRRTSTQRPGGWCEPGRRRQGMDPGASGPNAKGCEPRRK